MYYLNITIFYGHYYTTLENKLHNYLLKNNLTLFRKFNSRNSITFQIVKISDNKNQWTHLMDRMKYYNRRIVRIYKKRILSIYLPGDQQYLKFTITREITPISDNFRSYEATPTSSCNIII